MGASDPSAGSGDPDPDARDAADFSADQNPLEAEAVTWLVRRQDGLSPEEETVFQDWIAADPKHGESLDRLGGVWARLGELPPESIDVLKGGLPARQADHVRPSPLSANPAINSPPRQRGRRSWLSGWGRLLPQMAFAGLAAMVVAGGWAGWERWQQSPTYAETFTTARGQQTELSLPDGTRLWLDTATRTEVKLYRQRREVRLLEGQALFSVSSNVDQPFDVLAGPLRITVVGTRFSVRYTSSGLAESGVSVQVEEGRVRVARIRDAQSPSDHAQGSDTLDLTASQSVTADIHGRLAALKRQPAATAAAWREGRVILDDTPLGQALAEFERYADTGLVVNDSNVAALRLNGSFDVRQFNAFQRALPQVLPVRLQARSDGKMEIVQAR